MQRQRQREWIERRVIRVRQGRENREREESWRRMVDRQRLGSKVDREIVRLEWTQVNYKDLGRCDGARIEERLGHRVRKVEIQVEIHHPWSSVLQPRQRPLQSQDRQDTVCHIAEPGRLCLLCMVSWITRSVRRTNEKRQDRPSAVPAEGDIMHAFPERLDCGQRRACHQLNVVLHARKGWTVL